MQSIPPLLLALLAGLFTFGMTAVGAVVILLHRNPSQRVLDVMLGFSAGVMLAASYWSLLAPAVEIARKTSSLPWLPPALGFAAGGVGLWALDKVMPHAHLIMPSSALKAEGVRTPWSRSTLFVLAITLHHIPEGLALGVAAGAVATGAPGTSVGAAIALALGLGIQNLPEGLAVSSLLRREGQSRSRSVTLGAMTGSVEPIAAVAGAAAIALSTTMLPYGLAFAAGAMIFVVIEELIPECQRCGHADSAVLAAILGFTLMTVLDIALG
ncbi:MAG: ZIP family metal transporter [Actinobacteria bacterium HGW-Actinobacteria-7]|nr:MAG: ZIP family metal transporter [Actinobacteria bacterium HGW-Actinobacteria-7]